MDHDCSLFAFVRTDYSFCAAALAPAAASWNQRSDSIGLRDVHGVAALDRRPPGARPFGHGHAARPGGIALSSVAMRYQLGLALHAGSLILPLRAATPHGHLVSPP